MKHRSRTRPSRRFTRLPLATAQTLNMMKSIDAPHYDAQRTTYQQDLWHYTIARMVDAFTKGTSP